MIRIVNSSKGTVVADRAETADTSEKRNRGLLGRTGLEEGGGLWIVPTQSIHMFFMKFALDLIYLDKKKQVVKVVHNIKPWRMSLCLRAHSVLELPVGAIRRGNVIPGDQLVFEKVS